MALYEYSLESIDYRRRGNIEESEEDSEYSVYSEEEEGEEEQIINTEQIFKSDECVICLTNPSNVLFCDCGHIPICEKCDKTKSLINCPICKTKTTIKRMIEY